MSEGKKNSYRSILKGTSMLGGVTLFQIGVNLVRGKFVAMFLGPVGMGISSLFNSAGSTLQQFAGLGLNLGIVKEIAASKEDETSMAALMVVVKRLLFITALIGALICVVFSMPLSRLTFGNYDYNWQFMLLGAMVFFGVAGQGYLSVLQGLHNIKLISATSICGSLIGLLVGVPLYFFFGNKGIVPAMVILFFSTCVSAWIGVRKAVKVPKMKYRKQLHSPIAKKLISLGVVLVASQAIGTGCTYLINLFIRNFGALENVGLFQAANSLTNQYAGVLFTTMMLDFFPRLAEIADDNKEITSLVNRQFEIVALISSPLICLLILTSPLVISILLTEEFLPIMELLRWLGLGVLIKALMYPLGCIALSKDNKKLYFWMEGIFCNMLTLVLNCAGYYFFGLIGLGISLVIDCAICLALYYFVNRRLYDYFFSPKALLEGAVALILGGACFALSFITNPVVAYSLMGAVTAGAIARSAVMLKRRLR